MLDTFDLADKRQVQHNHAGWENHTIVTNRKNASHVLLNIDKLREDGYKEYERLMKEIWMYLQ